MTKRRVKRLWFLLLLVVLSNSLVAPVAAHANPGDVNAIGGVEQGQALIPLGRDMVDQAIDVLSAGLANMTPGQRALLDQLYDPGGTGDIDQEFVDDVLANYRRIRARLDEPLTIVRVSESENCGDQRLYYTDLATIYVCPYFDSEESVERKARVLVHETAHMALLVVDRPYFHKNTYSTRYRALTPRGSWTANLPVVGPLLREIARGDTLYHPDAYAWFAVEVAAS
jgi:hypothetical protein